MRDSILSKLIKKSSLTMAVLVCLCLGLGSSVNALAAEENNGLQKVVKLGYYDNTAFQEGAGPDQIKTGYGYEYYQKISEYTGWKYEYVYGEYDELYTKLINGEIDLLGGLAYKEDRTSIMLFPDKPMGKENYSLMKKSDKKDIFATAESLNGRTFGVLDSMMVEFLNNWLNEREIKAEVKTYKNYNTLFNAFDTNEFEILMVEGSSVRGQKGAEVFANITSTDYYMVVNHQREDLLQELNEAQNELEISEPYYVTTLHNKYLSELEAPKALGKEELEWIGSHGSIKVGYLKNYLPYSDMDSNNMVYGAVKDILPAIFKKLEIGYIDIEYVGYETYGQMIGDLSQGDLDVAFPVGGDAYFAEKDGIQQTSAVVSTVGSMVYSGEYSDSKMQTVAINKSNQMQEYYIRLYYPETELVYYDSTDACLEAVMSGEVGFTTLNGYRSGAILKNSKYRSLSSRQLSAADDRKFGVSPGNEGLLRILNRGINALGRTYFNSVIYNYVDGLYIQTPLDFLKDNLFILLIVGSLIVVLIVVLFLRDSAKKRRYIILEEEKNRELQRANAAKSAFLARMSHDIRTPLNGIIGLIEIGEAHSDDKKLIDENRKKAKVAADHLLSLISDVLDLSKMDDENVTLAHEPFDIIELATEVLTITKIRCVESGITLIHDDCRPHITHRYVYGSPLHLRQILINIFGNAIKYNKPNGSVSCDAQTICEDGKTVYLKIVIADTGIGMSEDFIKHLYEPFSQEHSDARSTYNGTGLGMAIVKRLVDKMNGTIDVMSRPGVGTSFTITIPLDVASEDDMPKTAVNDKTDFRGLRVLMAEDNELNQEILKTILEDMGIVVTVASDGEEAYDTFVNNEVGSFDLILMDLMMPRMNGYKSTMTIRDYPREDAKTIPIYAMTANAFTEDMQKCLEAGMDGHLAKPIEIDKLQEVLSQVNNK